jgi:hypothetical protein
VINAKWKVATENAGKNSLINRRRRRRKGELAAVQLIHSQASDLVYTSVYELIK